MEGGVNYFKRRFLKRIAVWVIGVLACSFNGAVLTFLLDPIDDLTFVQTWLVSFLTVAILCWLIGFMFLVGWMVRWTFKELKRG